MSRVINPELAGRELQHLLAGLNGAKHAFREKALKSFKTLAEIQGNEFYDDDVDTWLCGDGSMPGLLKWCGESSTGTEGALKRTAATAIKILGWLLKRPHGTGENENIWLSRFLHVPFDVLKEMRLDLHIRSAKSSGERGGDKEEACEIASMILKGHMETDSDELDNIEMEKLLPSPGARVEYIRWLQQSSSGKLHGGVQIAIKATTTKTQDQPSAAELDVNTSNKKRASSAPTEDIDPPDLGGDRQASNWNDVDQTQFEVEEEPLSPVVEFEDDHKDDGPVKDPLGIQFKDLRSYQRSLEKHTHTRRSAIAFSPNAFEGDSNYRHLKSKVKNSMKRPKNRPKSHRLNFKNMIHGQNDDDSRLEFDPRPSSTPQATASHEGLYTGSESVVPIDASFSPELFVLMIHSEASLAEVRAGLARLNSNKVDQAGQLQKLVRNNFDAYVRCADRIEQYAAQIETELGTDNRHHEDEMEKIKELRKSGSKRAGLSVLRQVLKAEREAELKGFDLARGANEDEPKEGRGAAQSHLVELTQLVEEAQKEAENTFSDLLEKLDQMTTVRAAQRLLGERGAVLDIPADMRSALNEGRHRDLVVLYKQALSAAGSVVVGSVDSLSGNEKGSILQQVVMEARSVGQKACEQLLEILRNPDQTLAAQEAAIDYLRALDYKGKDPLSLCLDAQTEHFLSNLQEVRMAFTESLVEAYKKLEQSYGLESTNARRGSKRRGLRKKALKAHKKLIEMFSDSEMTDEEEGSDSMTPRSRLKVSSGGSGLFDFSDPNARLFDDSDIDVDIVLDNDSGLDDGDRSADDAEDYTNSELEEAPTDVDPLMHYISVARIEHVANRSQCLGSWIPHLISLSTRLIRAEAVKAATSKLFSGSVASIDESLHSRSRHRMRHIRAISTVDFDPSVNLEEAPLTETEERLSMLFRDWLNDSSKIFRGVIFGIGDSGGEEADTYNGLLYSPTSHPTLAHAHRHETHLREKLGVCYIRQAIVPLAGMYSALRDTHENNFEVERILSPGLELFESFLKEVQDLCVEYEFAELSKEALGLKGGEMWQLGGEGGTQLPHKFLSMAKNRMRDLADLLPVPSWSEREVSKGLTSSVFSVLESIQDLAVETSKGKGKEIISPNVPQIPTAAHQVSIVEDRFFHTSHLLLCQLGNCLLLSSTVLLELWDTASDLFYVNMDGLELNRKMVIELQDRIQTMHSKYTRKNLVRVISTGWWGYKKPSSMTNDGEGNHSFFSSNTTIRRQREMLAAQRDGRVTTRRSSRRISATEQFLKDAESQVETLPIYIVQVLMGLVQTRLEAMEALGRLVYREATVTSDGRQRPEILYHEYILRDKARQVIDIVCDCVNMRVAGTGQLGPMPLDGSDPIETMSKLAEVEFLRNALWKYLSSSTIQRIARCAARIQAGLSKGGTVPLSVPPLVLTEGQDESDGNGHIVDLRDTLDRKDSMDRVRQVVNGEVVEDILARQITPKGYLDFEEEQPPGSLSGSSISGSRSSVSKRRGNKILSKPGFLSDAIKESHDLQGFLCASELQDLARVHVVCLK